MKYKQNQVVILVHPYVEDGDPKTATVTIKNFREVGNVKNVYTFLAEDQDGNLYQSTPCCEEITTPTYFVQLSAGQQNRLLGYFDFNEMQERLSKRITRLKEQQKQATQPEKNKDIQEDIQSSLNFLEKLTYCACVSQGESLIA